MTAAEAIKIAAGRVRFQSFGKRQGLSQYQVDHYDVDRHAWWQGNMTSSRDAALHTAWEAKVAIALELLGLGKDDAGSCAYRALQRDYPRDWRQVVRDEMRAHQQEKAA